MATASIAPPCVPGINRQIVCARRATIRAALQTSRSRVVHLGSPGCDLLPRPFYVGVVHEICVNVLWSIERRRKTNGHGDKNRIAGSRYRYSGGRQTALTTD